MRLHVRTRVLGLSGAEADEINARTREYYERSNSKGNAIVDPQITAISFAKLRRKILERRGGDIDWPSLAAKQPGSSARPRLTAVIDPAVTKIHRASDYLFSVRDP
jgi:hypothetical protein